MFFFLGGGDGLFGTTCGMIILITLIAKRVGRRVGTVVRALAFHQCGPGSIPKLGIIIGLSFMVLHTAQRGISLGTSVFPSPRKPTFDVT